MWKYNVLSSLQGYKCFLVWNIILLLCLHVPALPSSSVWPIPILLILKCHSCYEVFAIAPNLDWLSCLCISRSTCTSLIVDCKCLSSCLHIPLQTPGGTGTVSISLYKLHSTLYNIVQSTSTYISHSHWNFFKWMNDYMHKWVNE